VEKLHGPPSNSLSCNAVPFGGITCAVTSAASPLAVVCALIEREGRVLIAQRPAHKHLALAWEFPGGKIEAGESPEAALCREIGEELNCQIIVGQALPTSLYTYATITIRLHPFLAVLSPESPEPSPAEHIAIAWVSSEELEAYALAPADLPVVEDYRRTCLERRT